MGRATALLAASLTAAAGLIASPAAALPTGFVSTWDTAETSPGSSGLDQVALPLVDSGTYDFTVDWGDGQTSSIDAWDDPDRVHTYAAPGSYQLDVKGIIEGFAFNNSGDRLKLINVSHWGQLRLGNTGRYFAGAANMNATATDPLDLTDTTNFSNMFAGATSFNGTVNNWDVSRVTNMTAMFSHASSFNQDLRNWDVSAVRSMSYMFQYASDFDQDIGADGRWDVSKVAKMSSMFRSATSFNQDLAGWDISQVTAMDRMFSGIRLSTTHYDATLKSWAAQPVQSGVTFDGGLSKYSKNSDAQVARDALVTKGWTIVDGGATGSPTEPHVKRVVPLDGALRVVFEDGANGGSSITGYEYSTDGGTTFAKASQSASPITITAESTPGAAALVNGTAYDVVIRALNVVGTGAPSDAVSATPSKVPDAPTITGTTAGDGTISAEFVPGADGGSPISRYLYSTDGGVTFAEADGTTSPLLIATQSGGSRAPLTNDVEYRLQLKAVNPAGTSAASNEVLASPVPSAPAAPAAPVGRPGDRFVDVTVTAAPTGGRPTSYLVTAAPGGRTCTVLVPATSCRVTGLVNGTSYTFAAIASNRTGTSSPSQDSRSVVPQPPAVRVTLAHHQHQLVYQQVVNFWINVNPKRGKLRTASGVARVTANGEQLCKAKVESGKGWCSAPTPKGDTVEFTAAFEGKLTPTAAPSTGFYTYEATVARSSIAHAVLQDKTCTVQHPSGLRRCSGELLITGLTAEPNAEVAVFARNRRGGVLVARATSDAKGQWHVVRQRNWHKVTVYSQVGDSQGASITVRPE